MTNAAQPAVLTARQGHILIVTINRPEARNAVNADVHVGIGTALEEAENDPEIRVVIITGAGDKAFCAGADLQTGQSFKFDYSEPNQGFGNTLRVARASHVPLIARVNGACVAGGMGLMAMCDMVVAARHAIFGLPEVKVGVFPAQVLSVLGDLLPRRVLNELCLTGEPVSAERAHAVGLINAVADHVDDALQALLDKLLDKSPAAIRRGVYTLKQTDHMTFEQSLAFTESQIALFALSEDAAEGQLAFREKRQPNWTGK